MNIYVIYLYNKIKQIEIMTLTSEFLTANRNEIIEIESLPKGKLFDDAKNIESIFKKSQHSYSEVIEAFESNKDSAKTKTVSIRDIQITQPNIQTGKVISMLNDFKNLPIINAVQFNDAIVIFDGHHRLITSWALGMQKIKLNLVTKL